MASAASPVRAVQIEPVHSPTSVQSTFTRPEPGILEHRWVSTASTLIEHMLTPSPVCQTDEEEAGMELETRRSKCPALCCTRSDSFFSGERASLLVMRQKEGRSRVQPHHMTTNTTTFAHLGRRADKSAGDRSVVATSSPSLDTCDAGPDSSSVSGVDQLMVAISQQGSGERRFPAFEMHLAAYGSFRVAMKLRRHVRPPLVVMFGTMSDALSDAAG